MQSSRYGSIDNLWCALLTFALSSCAEPVFDSVAAGPVASLDGGVADSASPDGALLPAQDATLASHDGGAVVVVPCTDDPRVLGAECPGVVRCTSAGLCDLSDNICCVSAAMASCSQRTNCGSEQRIHCDGPEDCPQGKTCCHKEASLECLDVAECTESNRACHSDADCTRNRCLEGLPATFLGVQVLYFPGAGICRGL